MAWEGAIIDGSIEEWAAGAPSNQNTQLNNTTLQQLQKVDRVNHPNRTAHWAYDQADGYKGPHVFDGQSSLRATVAAGGAVDAFRIWTPGAVNVAFVGASTNDIPIEPFRPMTFRFAARVWPDGNLLRVRLVFRTAADAVAGYVTNQVGGIQAGAAVIVLGSIPTWRFYSVAFVPPQQIGANVLEHVIWQISNGTAAAQLIDLDAISLKPTDMMEDL